VYKWLSLRLLFTSPLNYGAYELEDTKGGDFGYSDAILIIKKNNNTIKEIARSLVLGTAQSFCLAALSYLT